MSAQPSTVMDPGMTVGAEDSAGNDADVLELGAMTGPSRADVLAEGRAAARGLLRGGSRSFWILISAVLSAGLVGVLLLSTTVNSDAFRLHELEKQANRLGEQQQAMQKRLAEMQSPDSLERKAIELGMVPNEVPVFLRLADGKILGVPTPAKPRPVPKPSTRAAPNASQGAAAGTQTAGQTAGQTGSGQPAEQQPAPSTSEQVNP